MAEIEHLLARCLTVIEEGQTIEECLARYPDRRDELEPLLRAAQVARAAPLVIPSSGFREGSRDRMVSMIQERRSRETPRTATERSGFFGWLRSLAQPSGPVRRTAVTAAAALTALLLIALVSVGVVHASSDTVPGDSLYPVKHAAERLRIAVSLTESEELRLRLQFASERLEEASKLASRGSREDIAPLMRRYAAEVEAASTILRRRRDRDAGASSMFPLVRDRLDQQQAQLQALQGTVSEQAQPAVQHALAVSEEAERRARELEAAPPGSPSATANPAMPSTATRTPCPSSPPSATADVGSREETASHTPSLRRQTKTPESAGRAGTTSPPGQTRTAMSTRPTRTSESQTDVETPVPPGLTHTPDGPERTRTPGPAQPSRTPQPPEADPPGTGHTPNPPDPGPPGPDSTPERPDPDQPGQGEGPEPPNPDPPGQGNGPSPPGNPDPSDPEEPGQPPDPRDPGPPDQDESPDQP